jgi:hypothetical protein
MPAFSYLVGRGLAAGSELEGSNQNASGYLLVYAMTVCKSVPLAKKGTAQRRKSKLNSQHEPSRQSSPR